MARVQDARTTRAGSHAKVRHRAGAGTARGSVMQGRGVREGGGEGGAPQARRQAGRAHARPPAVPRARRTRMPWRSSKASPLASAHEMRWRWKRRKCSYALYVQRCAGAHRDTPSSSPGAWRMRRQRSAGRDSRACRGHTGITHRGHLAPPQDPRGRSGDHIATTWVMHHHLCTSRWDGWDFDIRSSQRGGATRDRPAPRCRCDPPPPGTGSC